MKKKMEDLLADYLGIEVAEIESWEHDNGFDLNLEEETDYGRTNTLIRGSIHEPCYKVNLYIHPTTISIANHELLLFIYSRTKI